jgi:hypothetical protein
MIALAVIATPAAAYVWDTSEAPTGDEMTIQLCLGDFTVAQAGQILEAAEAWQAGSGRVLRGALWTYTWGTDRPDGTCAPGNGLNEIHAEDDDWFADHDSGGALATTMNDDAAVSAEVDFVFNTEDADRWSSSKPSKTAEDEVSVGMIALHEFGHGLGFNHDDTYVAVMNSTYPNGGDIAGGYHPHSDDYAGLAASRPDPSPGRNLLIGKFVAEPGDPGDAIEVWNSATDAWTVCREEVDGVDGPEPITALVQETGGPVTPTVAWTLSDDRRCFHGVEYEVGRIDLELGSGVPVLVQPEVYDFGAVPAGEYHLCAQIDADGLVHETREGDNRVRSEALVTVEDCP